MKFFAVLLTIGVLSLVALGQYDIRRGVDLYRAGQYAEAIEELEKLNAAGAGNHQSDLYLGAAYVRTGKTEDARRAFTRTRPVKVVKNIDGETPLKITSKKPPSAAGVPMSYQSGKAVLAVEFKHDSTIGFAFVVESSTPEFNRNCIDAAKKIKFTPATSNGKTVVVIKLIEYTFARY